ncbi:transporter substrate-binding domain-containing protein [Desulfovibrio sp. Huiquan2017]|uniref:substrate-binding periplasmic protein n=1 Tax=Desulfovibrio sp. Huiquan2017 TaxID=2816861 RepID=UPI001A91DB54|nr:transporter substrate-binding domain-containing protein [Desulfovibrio sp. Huiquan2017]
MFVLSAFPALAQARALRIVSPELGTCGSLKEGRPAGFCLELGDALARTAGMEPVNLFVPLARGVEEIHAGTADMIFMPQQADIVELAEDIGTVRPLTMVAWGRVETPLRTVRDLVGKTVAVVRGSRRELDLARSLKFIPFPCKNHELGFRMLLAGRVDAVLGSLHGLTGEVQRIGLRRRFLGDPLVLERNSLRAYVARRLPEAVRARLKKALARLVGDGTVARLRSRYPL